MNCCVSVYECEMLLQFWSKEIIIEIQLLLNENCEVYKKFKVPELGKYYLSNNCWTLEFAQHHDSWRNRERMFALGFPEKSYFDLKYCFLPNEGAK